MQVMALIMFSAIALAAGLGLGLAYIHAPMVLWFTLTFIAGIFIGAYLDRKVR